MVGVTFPLAVILSAVDNLSGPLKKAQTGLAKIGAQVKKVGRGMTIGLTAPALLAGGSIISTATGFEKSMATIQAVTSQPAEAIGGLRDLAKDLGATTKFSAREAADGMIVLSRAGFSLKETMAAAQPVLNLAAAANLDLAEAGSIAATSLRGFQLPAESMERITGALAVAANAANQDLTDIGEAMKFGAPAANAFGLSLEDTLGTLSQFANLGFKGSLGGTALSRALSDLAKITPGGQAAKTLSELGLSLDEVFDQNGRITDFVGLLDKLSKAAPKPAQLLKIFGERSVKPLLALMESGVAPIREISSALGDSLGEDARIAEIMMAGAAGAGERLAAAWEALQISIAESGLLDAFVDFARGLGEILTGLSKSNPALLKWGTIAVALLAALGPLLLTIGFMATGVAHLIPLFSKLSVVTKLWNASLLANPVVLITAAIVAAILAVIRFVQAFKNARDQGLGVAESLVAGIKAALQSVVDFVLFIPRAVLGVLDSILGGVKSFFGDFLSFLPDFVLDGLGLLPEETVENVQSRAETAQAFRTIRPPGAGGPDGAPGAGGKATVEVKFDNLPKGATVKTVGPEDLELEIDQGVTLAGG